MSHAKYDGIPYWVPDRKVDLVNLLSGMYPDDREKFKGMKVKQLKRIVHEVMKRRIDSGAFFD